MPCQGLRALEPRHSAWGATFKKVDKTIGGCGENKGQEAPPFEYLVIKLVLKVSVVKTFESLAVTSFVADYWCIKC